MNPNSNQMLKTGFFSGIKKVTKKHRRVQTQEERTELIFDLKAILETYKKYAAKLDKSGPPGKFELKCAQLAAYIARSINIIATNYDAANTKAILKELDERVSKIEQLRDQESRQEGQKPRKRG